MGYPGRAGFDQSALRLLAPHDQTVHMGQPGSTEEQAAGVRARKREAAECIAAARIASGRSAAECGRAARRPITGDWWLAVERGHRRRYGTRSPVIPPVETLTDMAAVVGVLRQVQQILELIPPEDSPRPDRWTIEVHTESEYRAVLAILDHLRSAQLGPEGYSVEGLRAG